MIRAIYILALAPFCCHVADAQETGLASDFPLPAEYSVALRLSADEQLVHESELNFIDKGPASVISRQLREHLDPVSGSTDESSTIGTLILAGTIGSQYEKPEQLTAVSWEGFWRAAEYFQLGALEFYVYDAQADHMTITASRAVPNTYAPPATSPADKQWEFYGELEAPLSCTLIEVPRYTCLIEGFHEGELVRQGQFGLADMPSSSAYQVCGAEPTEEAGGTCPECLLIVLPLARREHPLDWHVNAALGGLPEPPLDSTRLGPFELFYYFPESDKLVFSLWELAGEWSDDWQESATLTGRVTRANAQPMPE